MNVGTNGRISDGGVFNNCPLSKQLENDTLNIPTPRALPGHTKKVPFVIVADDAFAMKLYLMKPYAFRNLHGMQRIYNYRLSRARRIIENVFGIVSARFRVLRRSIELNPQKVSTIVSAICVLHNFLITRSQRIYAPQGTFDNENHEDGSIQPGEWRQHNNCFTPLQVNHRFRGSAQAKAIQLEFTQYFQAEGEVPWQYKYINQI